MTTFNGIDKLGLMKKISAFLFLLFPMYAHSKVWTEDQPKIKNNSLRYFISNECRPATIEVAKKCVLNNGQKNLLVRINRGKKLQKCPAIAFWIRSLDISKAPCIPNIVTFIDDGEKFEKKLVE